MGASTPLSALIYYSFPSLRIQFELKLFFLFSLLSYSFFATKKRIKNFFHFK